MAIMLLSTAQGHIVINTNLPARTTCNDELTLAIHRFNNTCALTMAIIRPQIRNFGGIAHVSTFINAVFYSVPIPLLSSASF